MSTVKLDDDLKHRNNPANQIDDRPNDSQDTNDDGRDVVGDADQGSWNKSVQESDDQVGYK